MQPYIYPIFNILKIVKDKFTTKHTSPKLIAYNDKMLTNNTIKSK